MVVGVRVVERDRTAKRGDGLAAVVLLRMHEPHVIVGGGTLRLRVDRPAEGGQGVVQPAGSCRRQAGHDLLLGGWPDLLHDGPLLGSQGIDIR